MSDRCPNCGSTKIYESPTPIFWTAGAESLFWCHACFTHSTESQVRGETLMEKVAKKNAVENIQ